MNKEETDLIIAEQNKSTEEILKAVAKVKSDYHELCKLKDMRIAELEKENAELKETVTKMNNVITKTFSNLTKAKELLKKFMKFYERTARECYSKDFQKTLADTEQFLSEVEK